MYKKASTSAVTKKDDIVAIKYKKGSIAEDALEEACVRLNFTRLNIHHKVNSEGFDMVALTPDNILVVINIDNNTLASANPKKYKRVKQKYVCTGEIKEELHKFSKIPAIRIWITCGRVFQEEDYKTLIDTSQNCIQNSEEITEENKEQHINLLCLQIKTIVDYLKSLREVTLSSNTVKRVHKVIDSSRADNIDSNSVDRNRIDTVDDSNNIVSSVSLSDDCISSYCDLVVWRLYSQKHDRGFVDDIGNYESIGDICFNDLLLGTSYLGGLELNEVKLIDCKVLSGHYTPLIFIDGAPRRLTVNKELSAEEKRWITKYIMEAKELSSKLGYPVTMLLKYYQHPRRAGKLNVLITMSESYIKHTNKLHTSASMNTIKELQKRSRHRTKIKGKRTVIGNVNRKGKMVYYRTDSKEK